MFRLLAIAFVFLATCLHTSAATAGNPFEINGVRIDSHGQSVLAARERAISMGTLDAFYQLMDRLTLPQDRVNLDPPLVITEEIAEQFVAGIQIANERRSRSRYLGELSVTFDAELIRNFLKSSQLPFVESQATQIPVIALWQDREGVVHWQEQNPYARNFADAGHQNNLTPLVLASDNAIEFLDGDTDPEAGKAVTADQVRARRLANLAPGVLIEVANASRADTLIIATGRDIGTGIVRIRVRQVVLGQSGVETVTDLGSFSGNAPTQSRPAELRNSALVIATTKMAMVLEDRWKQQAIVRTDQRQSILLTARYENLAQWLRLRDALGRVSLVEEARLDALGSDGALLMLTYRGSEEQLARRFAQRGINLTNEDIGLVAQIR